MRNIRTDLAMEAAEGAGDLPGVKISRWEETGVEITEVIVSDESAAERLGKRVGTYVTLESRGARGRDIDSRLALSSLLGEELARLTGASAEGTVLVAGLGNRSITPDSLGPRVIDRTLVTRHIFSQLGTAAAEGMKNVCAIAPGVLGVTGVETAEMLKCVVDCVSPACVICVDALAARSSDRIGSAVQISNTGIFPGSGVGNNRRALTRETLGAEVVAVGMPTVIYAATLARDAFALTQDDLSDEELERLERELMSGEAGEMIVTPRDIDELIENAAGIIASGINRALQPEMSDEEISAMMS